jgi:hypothetical protein
LAAELARQREVTGLTLVDPDAVQEKDLFGQQFEQHDIGTTKVAALARRIGRIRPSLAVRVFPEALESIPAGELRKTDALCTGLDSREPRQTANEMAFHLGIPLWVDGGVRSSAGLGRVSVFQPPDPTSACMECQWGDADYAQLGVRYGCLKGTTSPTNAPSHLGAMVASFMVAAVLDHGVSAEQLVIHSRGERRLVESGLRRNPACRFSHARWNITTLKVDFEESTLGWLVEEMGPLSLPGKPFAETLTCAKCGRQTRLVCVEMRLTSRQRLCPCGGSMAAGAFDLVETIDGSGPLRRTNRSLRRAGLRAGDVVRTEGGEYFELDGGQR